MTPTRWLWAIVLLAAALRLFPVWFGLPYPYARPDEAQAISGAVGVLAGDLNPHFFHWPSLTFYLFAAVLGIVSNVRSLIGIEPLPLGAAVIAARVVVALAGALTTIPVFRLTRRIAGDRAGLLAAGFLAVAPLHVRDSHFAMTDVLMTRLLAMCLACLVAAYDGAAAGEGRSSHRRFAVAGLLGGLATSTKYNAAAILASMAAVQILLWQVPGRSSGTDRRALSVLPSLMFAGALAAGFVVATPFAVLDAASFIGDLRYDLTHLSGGHAVPLGRGWWVHAVRSLPYGCGPLVFAAALAGLAIAIRRHPRHTLIVGAFAFAFYGAIGSGFTVFFRYVMPLVPIVCLFAALAVNHASELMTTRALAIALGAAIAVPSAWTSVRMDLLLARTDTRVLAARWLGPQLQPEHTLHDAGSDYTRLDMRTLRYHEWRFDPKTQSFGHPAGLTPDWLVIGDSPLRHYASADPGLRELAAARYDAVYTVRATTTPSPRGVYDEQDAFFLPFSGFNEIERPGPTITIYRRRD
jgi:4-amino-4-deoxy-L-arabinose transferase-like glycosyltransferase